QRIGWLDIVVSIEKHCRCNRHTDALSKHHRPASSWQHLRLQAYLVHHLGDIGGHLAYPFSVCADTGVAQVIDQALKKVLPMVVNVGEEGGKVKGVGSCHKCYHLSLWIYSSLGLRPRLRDGEGTS